MLIDSLVRGKISETIADAGRLYHSCGLVDVACILLAVAGAVAEEQEESLSTHVTEWVRRRQTAREISRSATQAFGGP